MPDQGCGARAFVRAHQLRGLTEWCAAGPRKEVDGGRVAVDEASAIGCAGSGQAQVVGLRNITRGKSRGNGYRLKVWDRVSHCRGVVAET